MDIKTKVQNLDASVQSRNILELVQYTGNIYETIGIVAKRARQLSVDIKYELHQKLEEFAVSSDAIEEVHENKEQIEISKFYERLPNSAMIATEEYLRGELTHRFKEERNKDEE